MIFNPEMQGWYGICKSINLIHHIKKMKDKNHMIISIDAERAFDKIHHTFTTKTLSKVVIEGTYLKIMASYMTNPLPASYSLGQNYKRSPSDQEKYRDVCFHLFYST